LSSGHTNEYAGTWQVRGEIMTLTPTRASGPDPEIQVGDIVHFTIVSVDAHHLSYTANGHAVTVKR
jgi:hypothetical protein